MGYRYSVDPIDVLKGCEGLIEALRLVPFMDQMIPDAKDASYDATKVAYDFTGTKRPEPYIPMVLMARALGGDKSAISVEVRGESEDDVGHFHYHVDRIEGSGRYNARIEVKPVELVAMLEDYVEPFKRLRGGGVAEMENVLQDQVTMHELFGVPPEPGSKARVVWDAMLNAGLEPNKLGAKERFEERAQKIRAMGFSDVPETFEGFIVAAVRRGV